jgi:acetylornithine/succinyldiaminopimelate/putrescine aminotransferase
VSGARLKSGLEKLTGVASVRGEGLLLAAVLTDDVAVPACRRALAAGLVINAPRPDVLRFAPSLLVSDADIDEAVGTVQSILEPLVTGSDSGSGSDPDPDSDPGSDSGPDSGSDSGPAGGRGTS